MTAVDLDSVRRRCDRLLADDLTIDEVSLVVSQARGLAKVVLPLLEEMVVLRDLVDRLECDLKVLDAERLAAVGQAVRLLAERREAIGARRPAGVPGCGCPPVPGCGADG